MQHFRLEISAIMLHCKVSFKCSVHLPDWVANFRENNLKKATVVVNMSRVRRTDPLQFFSPSPLCPPALCSCATLAGVRRRAVNMDGGAESIPRELLLLSSGCARHHPATIPLLVSSGFTPPRATLSSSPVIPPWSELCIDCEPSSALLCVL